LSLAFGIRGASWDERRRTRGRPLHAAVAVFDRGDSLVHFFEPCEVFMCAEMLPSKSTTAVDLCVLCQREVDRRWQASLY
jgi:hypothetical protein